MKVLVTGNQGYIGSVLTDVLLQRGYEVIGFDIGYFKECSLYPRGDSIKQIICDVRDVEAHYLDGVDAVIHLAALSNDPLGEIEPTVTEAINYDAVIRLARLAHDNGVQRFVYASTQSIYGISKTADELDEETSVKNPITAYAKTKWKAEQELRDMNSNQFIVSCFRPSTVFGASQRLRGDIVFNNLVGSGLLTGAIEILSDGSPWRPVVHIRDVCAAFVAGLEAPAAIIGGAAFNVGIPNGNYTVKDLAVAAQRSMPDCKLAFLGQHSDPRSYRVSFTRIQTELAEHFKPRWSLDAGARELIDQLVKYTVTEEMFRGRRFTRIKQLEYLRDENILTDDLRWVV